MTPKQKANFLVALFEITAHPNIDMDKQLCKTCALKCVNEIIDNVLNWIDLASTWGDYWYKVKAEIELL